MVAEQPKDVPANRQPANFSTSIEITGSVMITCALVIVACRLYVRYFRKRTAGLDDFCILLAACINIACGVAQLKFTRSGFGKHMWQLSRPAISYAMKWFVICTFESYICLFFIRASIGIFVLRLLSPAQLKSRLAVYLGLFSNFAVTFAVLTIDAMWCRPIEGLWNKTIPAKCMSAKTVGNANITCYAISAATDVLFASLPVIICWPRQMDWKLKRNLSIIMALSLATCICAIGKATSIRHTTTDVTYADVPVTFWAIFEVNLGIIVASLPALRQFYTVTTSDITTFVSSRRSSPINGPVSVDSNYMSSSSWPGTTSRQTMRTFYDDRKSMRSTWRAIESKGDDIELNDRKSLAQVQVLDRGCSPTTVRTLSPALCSRCKGDMICSSP